MQLISLPCESHSCLVNRWVHHMNQAGWVWRSSARIVAAVRYCKVPLSHTDLKQNAPCAENIHSQQGTPAHQNRSSTKHLVLKRPVFFSLLQRGAGEDLNSCNPAAFCILIGRVLASSQVSHHWNSSTLFSALEIHDSQNKWSGPSSNSRWDRRDRWNQSLDYFPQSGLRFEGA